MSPVKKLFLFTILSIILISLMGCNAKVTKTMSYTFKVETGDNIKLTLDTSDNYKITSKLPFSILHNEETLSKGTFITSEAYQQYKDVVSSDEKAELIKDGSKDGNEYIFWSYNESEYNYAILIAESNTAVLIGNQVSKDSAKECFDRLKISKTK